MTKPYTIFFDTLKNLSSKEFMLSFYFRHNFAYCHEGYQDLCRVYLDEYPEQKELRKNWFGKKQDRCLDYKFHVTCPHGKTICKNCERIILVCGCQNRQEITYVTCSDCQTNE